MKYHTYVAALSRLIQRTATVKDMDAITQYEEKHPAKNCLHCGRRTRTMFEPYRVTHAEDECTKTKPKK